VSAFTANHRRLSQSNFVLGTAYETLLRFVHPQHLTDLWVLAAAGVVGFIGNQIAAADARRLR
jgi:NADPH-dependent curcumin reductase CurA